MPPPQVKVVRVIQQGAPFIGVGSFLSANVARVDISGNDGTGIVGDITRPFLTAQAALTALENQGGFTQNNPAVLQLPLVDSTENVTTSLQYLIIHGLGLTNDGTNPALGILTLTNDGAGGMGVILGLSNVWISEVVATNIDSNSFLDVYMDAAVVAGDINCTGAVSVSATYNTGAVYGTITCATGTSMTVRGLIGSNQSENFPNLHAVNSPLTVYFSLIDRISAATSIDLYDSRVNTNTSGVTPNYNDALLANPIFPTSNPHIAGAGYWVGSTFTKSTG